MSRPALQPFAFAVLLAWVRVANAQTPAAPATFPMPAPSEPVTLQPTPPRLHAWRGSTILGLTSGLGSPYGLLGAFVGFFPAQHLELEVGGGYSTGFGPSVAALGRVGFNPGDSSFLALGLGLSTNFSDYRYAENCDYPSNGSGAARCTPAGSPRIAEGSASALWLNVEVSEDIRLGRNFGGRIAAGAAFLLNPGAFPAAVGCDSDGLGQSPCEVGVSRTRDEPVWVLHVRLDLYAVIVHGDL